MKIFFYQKIHTPCASSKNLFLKVEAFFKYNDYTLVSDPNEADYILFNTCGFLESIERELLLDIKDHADTYKKKIIIFGCLGSISKSLSEIPEISHIIKVGFEHMFDQIFAHKISIANIYPPPHKSQFGSENDTEVFVIQTGRGCIQACTFCTTKRAIGHIKSVPVAEIVSIFRKGLADGYKKFFLVGDDIASYGKDIGIDFSDLFNELCTIEGEYSFILDHTETSGFTNIFPKIAHNFSRVIEISLPAQSFSDRKLELMGRKYTAKEFLKLASDIKSANPSVYLVNYIIYGYPTETSDEFYMELKGANLCDKNIFFLYSERPYTKIFPIEDKLSTEIIKERTKKVYQLQLYNSEKFVIGGFFTRAKN